MGTSSGSRPRAVFGAVFTDLVGAITDLTGINYSPTYPYSQSEFRGALGLGSGVTLSLSIGRLGGSRSALPLVSAPSTSTVDATGPPRSCCTVARACELRLDGAWLSTRDEVRLGQNRRA